MNLITRRISIIAAVGVIVLSLFISKKIGKKYVKEAPVAAKSARLVKSITVNNQTLPAEISVTGRLVASKRIELFAEVNGLLLNTNFKEGTTFNKGNAVVVIDDAEARTQLKAQKATFFALISQALADLSFDYPEDYKTWKLFQDKLSFEKQLPNLPEATSSQAKAYLSGKNIYTTYYNIKSQEVRLAKYNIHAPFNGVLAQTSIDPGALVRNGQKLGEFINNQLLELEAPISLQDLKYVKVGDKVNLHSNDISGNWTGTIARINEKLDAGSQSLMLYIQVQSNQLREGMYLNASIKAHPIDNAFEIARKLIFDGNKIYTIAQDSILKITEIEVVRFNQDKAIVKGLQNQSTILAQTVSGVYDNMIVKPIK